MEVGDLSELWGTGPVFQDTYSRYSVRQEDKNLVAAQGNNTGGLGFSWAVCFTYNTDNLES